MSLQGHVVKHSNGSAFGQRVRAFSADMRAHGGLGSQVIADRRRQTAARERAEQWRAAYTPPYPDVVEPQGIVSARVDRLVHRERGMARVDLPLSSVTASDAMPGVYLVRVRFTADCGLVAYKHYPLAALTYIAKQVALNAARNAARVDVGEVIDAEQWGL